MVHIDCKTDTLHKQHKIWTCINPYTVLDIFQADWMLVI